MATENPLNSTAEAQMTVVKCSTATQSFSEFSPRPPRLCGELVKHRCVRYNVDIIAEMARLRNDLAQLALTTIPIGVLSQHDG